MRMESNQETNPQLLTTLKENENQCQTCILSGPSTEAALTAIENKLVKMIAKEMRPVMNVATSLAEQAIKTNKYYEYLTRIAKEFKSFMNETRTKINSFEIEFKNFEQNTNLALKEQMKEYSNHLSTIKHENKTEITVLHNKFNIQMQSIQSEQSALKNELNKMDKQEIIMQIENCHENVNFNYQKLKKEIDDLLPFIKNIDVIKNDIELIKELQNFFISQNKDLKSQNVFLQNNMDELKLDLLSDKNRFQKLEHDQTESKSSILDHKIEIINLQQDIDLIRCDSLKNIQIVQQNLEEIKDDIEKTSQELLANLLSDQDILKKLQHDQNESKSAILDNKIDIVNLQKDIDLITDEFLKDMQIMQQKLKDTNHDVEKVTQELMTNFITQDIFFQLKENIVFNDVFKKNLQIVKDKIDENNNSIQLQINSLNDQLTDFNPENKISIQNRVETTSSRINLLSLQMVIIIHFLNWMCKSSIYKELDDGNSLLFDILSLEVQDFFKLIKNIEANVNCKNKNNESLLHVTSGLGFFSIVNTLIENGANIDSRDKDDWSPLDYAAREGHLSVVETLIKHGADVNSQSENNESLLHVTSRLGFLSIVNTLIENGANIHCRDKYKWCPLHYASRDGNLSVVETLIKHGANVNSQTKNGDTPLLWSAVKDHLLVVEELLKHGADINIQDKDGRSSLHWAAFRGHLPVVEMLVKHGANVNSQSKDKKTALSLARNEDIKKFLIQHGAK